jgi:hypothetical protein
MKIRDIFRVLVSAMALQGTFKQKEAAIENPLVKNGFAPFDEGANVPDDKKAEVMKGVKVVSAEDAALAAERANETVEERQMREEEERIAAELAKKADGGEGASPDKPAAELEADKKLAEDKKKVDDIKAAEGVQYKIGDKVLESEELGKVQRKLEERFGKEYLDGLPDDKLEVLTQEYVHILDGTKSLNAKHQELAKEGRKLEDEKAQLAADRASIAEREDKAHKLLAEIQNQREQYKKVLEAKPKDEFDDAEIRKLEISQELARQNDEALAARSKTVAGMIEQIRGEDEEAYYDSIILELQQDVPDLQTDAPIIDIINKAAEGNIAAFSKKADEITEEDEKELEQVAVAERVKLIFNGYIALMKKNPDSKLTVAQYYKTQQRNLPELKRSAAQTAKTTIVELKAGKLKETYKRLAERQAKEPPQPKGGGSGTHSTERVQQGTPQAQSEYWKKLGYADFDNIV